MFFFFFFSFFFFFFFFNDTATTEIYTLSLHDALPISLPTTSFLLPPLSLTPSLSLPSPSIPAIPLLCPHDWGSHWLLMRCHYNCTQSEYQSSYLICSQRTLLTESTATATQPSYFFGLLSWMDTCKKHARLTRFCLMMKNWSWSLTSDLTRVNHLFGLLCCYGYRLTVLTTPTL